MIAEELVFWVQLQDELVLDHQNLHVTEACYDVVCGMCYGGFGYMVLCKKRDGDGTFI